MDMRRDGNLNSGAGIVVGLLGFVANLVVAAGADDSIAVAFFPIPTTIDAVFHMRHEPLARMHGC